MATLSARPTSRLNRFHRLPVSPATRRRWGRTHRVPRLASLTVRLLEGELGAIAPEWTGWRIQGAALVSPEGECWNPGRLQAWLLELQLLDCLKRRLLDPQQPRLF